MKEQVCCQCEARSKVTNLYGYSFCVLCESKLGLHTDKTILRNAESHDQSKPISYEDEVPHRLQTMEKDFVKSAQPLDKFNYHAIKTLSVRPFGIKIPISLAAQSEESEPCEPLSDPLQSSCYRQSMRRLKSRKKVQTRIF
jgi:hypothetical protein